MNILLKSVTISDPSSTHFNSVKDVFIKNGKIAGIEKKLNLKGEQYRVIDGKGKSISQGWVDLKSDFCDPGPRRCADPPSRSSARQSYRGLP